MLYAIKFMPVIVYIKIVIQWGLKILLFMAIVPTARRLYKAKGVKATNTTAVSAHTNLKQNRTAPLLLYWDSIRQTQQKTSYYNVYIILIHASLCLMLQGLP